MNELSGRITSVESSEDMSIVEVDVSGDRFCTIILETPATASYLKIGTEITLLFKETEVSIAKSLSGFISLRNRIPSQVKSIEKSPLLSKVVLNYKDREIVSIITTSSVKRLDLKEGDFVEWLVKTNEISLLKKDSHP